jgi:hypothetical protein
MLLMMVVTISLMSCTDEKGTRKALLDAGYHPIEVGGHAWFAGGKDDVFATKFKAYSPDSTRIVEGAVTRGWFKGSTIRTN